MKPFTYLLLALFLAGCSVAATQTEPSQTPGIEKIENLPTVSQIWSRTPSPGGTRSAAQPTVTSGGSTATSSPRPTRTPPPPSPTSTDTPEPVETSLVPAPIAGARYRLRAWSSDQADQLAQKLQAYPETLSFVERGRRDTGYYGASRYAHLALAEARYRFPEAAQAGQWQQDHAYRLAQSGDNGAGQAYAALLADWLNSGKLKFDDLEAGFDAAERRLVLRLTPLPALPGHSWDALVVVGLLSSRGTSPYTGIGLWLFEQDGVFSAYHLPGGEDFSFPFGEEFSLDAIDVTGDLVPEAILWQKVSSGPAISNTSLRIFDLTQTPPKPLVFEPGIPEDNLAWSVGSSSVGRVQLVINSQRWTDRFCYAGFPGFTWTYQWQNKAMRLQTFDLQDQSAWDGEYWLCYGDFLYDLFGIARQPNEPARRLARELARLDPIKDHLMELEQEGRLEQYDEIRYLQSLIFVESGDTQGARQKLNEMIQNPGAPDSSWVETARGSLDALKNSANLLEICLAGGRCQQFSRISGMASLIPAAKLEQAPEFLQKAGIVVTDSGLFDFNNDGQPELWALVADNPENLENLDLIILYKDGEYLWTEYGYLNTGARTETPKIVPANGFGGNPVHRIDLGNAIIPILGHAAGSGVSQPVTILEYWERYALLLDFQNQLLEGQDPLQIAQALETFAGSILENDKMAEPMIQAYYTYLQGLAYELADQNDQAVHFYLSLWQTYPDQPYAILAQAKLEPVP